MDDFTDFKVISGEEFDALPENHEQRRYPAIWDPALDALELGDAVRLPCRDDEDGCDAGRDLVRRARARGILIEVRYGEGFVAARRKDRGDDDIFYPDHVPSAPEQRRGIGITPAASRARNPAMPRVLLPLTRRAREYRA